MKMDDRELVQKHYTKVQQMRLLDDDFMTAVFSNYHPAVQKTLQIIMNDPNLEVLEVHVQDSRKNLTGRSVRLDVLVQDENGRVFNVEIQRSDKGAGTKRARYNLGLVDAGNLKAGEDFSALPDTYIIFITENDVMGKGLPIYHVERVIMETQELFNDDEHIIFVNAAYTGEDPIGKLMADFRASDPAEIHYQELAQPLSYFKTNEGGVRQMCRLIEKERSDAFAEGCAKGKAELSEALRNLSTKLSEQHRQDELILAATDLDAAKRLFKEFNIPFENT